MSLLPSTNAGSDTVSYFIENVGGSGDGLAPVPCIKAGDAFGLVRVGNPNTGLVIGSTIGGTAVVRGGGATSAAGSTLALGSSAASTSNIVLTDAITTINGTLSVPGGSDVFVGDNISLGGDLIFTNGSLGKSITGQYAASTAVVAAGPIANPAGLTPGVYVVTYGPDTLVGNEGAEPSGVFVRTSTQWVGNAVGSSFGGGVPNAALTPTTAGSATLTLGGGSPAVPGVLFYRKISN